MNGAEWLANILDELDRTKEKLLELSEDDETMTIVNDIRNDMERYYDYSESINDILTDIEM